MRYDHNGSQQPQAGRAARKEGERSQLVEAVPVLGGGPRTALGVGIGRAEIARHDEVVVYREEGEARALGGLGHLHVSLARKEDAARQGADAELDRHPLALYSPTRVCEKTLGATSIASRMIGTPT